jgi:hypothetical protein
MDGPVFDGEGAGRRPLGLVIGERVGCLANPTPLMHIGRDGLGRGLPEAESFVPDCQGRSPQSSVGAAAEVCAGLARPA